MLVEDDSRISLMSSDDYQISSEEWLIRIKELWARGEQEEAV